MVERIALEFRTCEATDFNMSAPVGSSSAPVQSSGGVIQDYYNGNKNSGY